MSGFAVGNVFRYGHSYTAIGNGHTTIRVMAQAGDEDHLVEWRYANGERVIEARMDSEIHRYLAKGIWIHAYPDTLMLPQGV